MRVALALLIALWTSAGARAQPAPVLNIEGPASLGPARTRVERVEPGSLSTIVRAVGLDAPGPPIRVVLAEPASDWARQVPPWAAGFAIGEASLVVLFPSRSPAYPHDTLEDVLRHEVAHVLITRSAGAEPVPRWFHEGLAVAVERPWDLEDRARLASALLFGPRLDLPAIDALFAASEPSQRRAYLLSSALVRHLIHEHGAGAPARLLRGVASGRSFDEALAEVAARSVPRFEAEFWQSQRTWTTWVPFIASSTVLWLGVIGLAILARRRRRQRSQQLRAGWASEDEAGQPPGPS